MKNNTNKKENTMKTKMKITNTKNVQVQFLPAQKSKIKYVHSKKSNCCTTTDGWLMLNQLRRKSA